MSASETRKRLAVAVLFGGRSVEHEVSVITAQQAMAALPAARFDVVPVYIAKDGTWYSGDALRDLERYRDIASLLGAVPAVRLRNDAANETTLVSVGRRGFMRTHQGEVARFDIAMPLVHGSHGEDGTLQGLFELHDIAYTGCGVAAAAVSMDKPLAKAAMVAAGLQVLDCVPFDRGRWRAGPDELCAQVEALFPYPVFVKPRSLGSSIGVSRAGTRDELRDAIELALAYDSRALIEPAQEGIVEINCAVLGRGSDTRVSVCEQPQSEGPLSYADKYLHPMATKSGAKSSGTTSAGMKGAQRLIPAPISPALTERIQDAASKAFAAVDAEGVARVDFLARPERDEFVVNEINTVPGSLSFYLWERSGLPFGDLLSELVDLGVQRHEAKRETAYSIDTWLLSGAPPR